MFKMDETLRDSVIINGNLQLMRKPTRLPSAYQVILAFRRETSQQSTTSVFFFFLANKLALLFIYLLGDEFGVFLASLNLNKLG